LNAVAVLAADSVSLGNICIALCLNNSGNLNGKLNLFYNLFK